MHKLTKRKQTSENHFSPNKKRFPLYRLNALIDQKDFICSQAVSFGSLKETEKAIEAIFQTSRWGQQGDCTLSNEELHSAKKQHCSLLFGEVLPTGIDRLCDADLLNIRQQRSLIDLGCGLGKLIVQVFFACPNLETVWGIEFSRSRFEHLRRILTNFVRSNRSRLSLETVSHNVFQIREGFRTLQIRCGDMFNRQLQREIIQEKFDVVIIETEIPAQRLFSFARLLRSIADVPSCHLLTYHNLESLNKRMEEEYKRKFLPFSYLRKIFAEKEDIHKRLIKTSWSKGHLFDIWVA